MTQRPPQRPAPPPVPDLAAYRPFEERQGAAPPPIEQRFGPAAASIHASVTKPVLPRRKRRWLRAVAWTLAGMAVLTAGSIAALVTFAPVGMIREQLIREVHVRTGRDLVIAGRTSLSIYPALGMTMADVSLSAPSGMGGAPFVRMKQLDVRVQLMPLLSRQVAVERLVLSEPVFELRVDPRGRRSWDFAAISPTPAVMLAQASQPKQQGQGAGPQPLPAELQEFLRNATPGQPTTGQPTTAPSHGTASGTPPRASRHGAVPDIALGDIRVRNGTVRYRDERGGLAEEVRAINARVAGKSLVSALEIKGDLALRGEKVDFEGRIGSPKALLEERASRISLAVNAPRVTGRFDGALSIARGAELDGKAKLDATSLRNLAAWIGARIPEGPGLGAVAAEAELKSGPTWVTLGNLKAKLDEIATTGSINADFVGGRPSLRASLRFAMVDLNPYLTPGEARREPVPEGRSAPATAPSSAGARPAPQVKGFTQRSGWSEAPIDLSPLGLADIDAKLSLAGLRYQDVKLDATELALAVKSKAARVTIEEVRLYGGQGRGSLTIEPGGAGAAVAARLSLDGVAGLALLKDVAGLEWLDGKAKLQLAIGGNGANQRAIVETLAGTAEFGFADGAIIGFNIPQMIRGLGQGRISGFQRVPTERTDFSEAGASFQIRNGIAETKDLRAMSPLLRLTGTGTANLGQRQVDATLRPRIVGTLAGQGGPGGLAGLELPVRVKGPWEKPQIGPDMDSLLKNPNQAIDTVREIGRQLQQGKSGGLNNLLEQFRRR